MGLLSSTLLEPVTDKESTDESNEKLICGASSMQGWRPSQEDAHNLILDYDTDTAFFAVYDGHRGHEVAQYCSEKLPEFIKNSDEYKKGKIEDALTLGFLRFDALIKTPEVVEVLKEMARKKKDEESEAQTSEIGKQSKNGAANTSEEAEAVISEKEAPVQNGEISTSSTEATKSDVTSSLAPVENGTPSKEGKGKAVIKPEPVKTPINTRPKRNAQPLYKNLDTGEEEDSDNTDDEDQTFEEPKEESSDDDVEGVNISIDVSKSSKDGEKEKNEDDEETVNCYSSGMTEIPGFGSGCTAVVALLKGNQLYVANAGDSRCIVCRDGKAIEMSIDHKPYFKPEKQRIITAGGEVTGGSRVNGGPNLSRAIGDHVFKQNKKLSDREQMITALPDVKTLTVNPSEDEFIFLACDGIWDVMSNQKVVNFIRPRIMEGREKLSLICEELFDHCLRGGGRNHDNMTAVIVKTNNKKAVSLHTEEPETKRAKSDTESEEKVDTTA